MASLKFEIVGERGTVSILTYRNYVDNAFGMLREFDAALSHNQRGSLGWYISDLQINNGYLLEVQSRIRPWATKKNLPDFGKAVANNFISGWNDIEKKAITPPYLSEFGLTRAKEIADLIGKNGAKGFRVSSENQSVKITHATTDNLKELLPIKRSAIGAIEGRIEQISIHRQAKFIVYHSVTNRAVNCMFDQARLFDDVKDALGKRVNVKGTLLKNSRGDTLRIEVDSFRILGDNPLLTDEIWASEPQFVEAENTEELLRRIRGD